VSNTASIQERREQRREQYEKAKKAQFEIDLEALDSLEAEHGYGAVGSIEATRYVDGLTTRVFFRTPSTEEYDRYTKQYGRATDKKSTEGQRDALALLGRTCWLYPADVEVRKKMVTTFPGLAVVVGLAAAKRGEGEQEAEGKD
jgi:hypothetical protein